MTRSHGSETNSTLTTLLVLVIVAMVGFTGWYVWQAKSNTDKTLNSANKGTTSATVAKPKAKTPAQDNTVNSNQYLTISEWGVRAPLPTNLEGKVTYKILEAQDPDTGLPLAGADIYVEQSALKDVSCAVTNTPLGQAVFIATTYLRSDSSKTFNPSRYKGTFKENIFQDGKYDYHLNYVMPDCISDSDQATIKQLQASLLDLKKAS